MLLGMEPAFNSLAENYREAWRLSLVLTDTQGNVILGGNACCRDCTDSACAEARRMALQEALRWGEPSMLLCPDGYVVWAVPVMHNALEIGGLVVERASIAAQGTNALSLSASDIRHAACDLLSMAEEANMTNAALLQLRRTSARRESERAEAIHELKGQDYRSIRDIYLMEEPSLITSIKRGDRSAAREILNRILVGIYYYGRERPTLLKSFILELVVTMSRSAVEAGADPSELLGTNYSSFTELAHIDAEEELCAWLVSMIERIDGCHKIESSVPKQRASWNSSEIHAG